MNKNARNILLLLLVFIIGIILMMYFFKSKYEEEFDTEGILQWDEKYMFYPNTTISKNINDVIIKDISGSYADGQIPWIPTSTPSPDGSGSLQYTKFSTICENIPNCIGFNTRGYFFKDNSLNIIDSSFVITPYYKFEDSTDNTVGFYMRRKIPTTNTSLTQKRLDDISSFFRSVEKQVKCALHIQETSETIEQPDEVLDDYIEYIGNSTLFNIEKDIVMLEKFISPQLRFDKITIGKKNEPATLLIKGDQPDQTIDLVLVQGDRGPPGPTGRPGATGDKGLQGAIGERGTTGTYETARNPNIR